MTEPKPLCPHECPPGVLQFQRIAPGEYKCRLCGDTFAPAPTPQPEKTVTDLVNDFAAPRACTFCGWKVPAHITLSRSSQCPECNSGFFHSAPTEPVTNISPADQAGRTAYLKATSLGQKPVYAEPVTPEQQRIIDEYGKRGEAAAERFLARFPEPVTPTDAEREQARLACIEIHEMKRRNGITGYDPANVQASEKAIIARALARTRQEAMEEAAQVAEAKWEAYSQITMHGAAMQFAATEIAAAIRAKGGR